MILGGAGVRFRGSTRVRARVIPYKLVLEGVLG